MKEEEKLEFRGMDTNKLDSEERYANDLFRSLEETMKCIAFTNAVDYCINISLQDPYNYEGHFLSNEFENGKYDTVELLEKLYDDFEMFLENHKERFTCENDVIGYIKFMCEQHSFYRYYKYLNGFIEHINVNMLKLNNYK